MWSAKIPILFLFTMGYVCINAQEEEDDDDRSPKVLDRNKDSLQLETLPGFLFGVVSSPLRCPPNYQNGDPSQFVGSGGGDTSTGRCFRLVTEQETWARAQKTCEEDLGNLVTVTSMEVEKFVVFLQVASQDPGCTHVWTGLSRQGVTAGAAGGGDSPAWLWRDGSGLGAFQPWVDGEPRPNGESNGTELRNDCAYLNVDGMYADNCQASKCFICEKKEENFFEPRNLLKRTSPGLIPDGSTTTL